MTRARLLVPLVSAWLAGCGGGAPIPAVDLSLRVVAGATEVGCGEAFPLTVVRVWRKDLVPAAWDERALAPLTLRLASSARREDDRRVEETRTYHAYAFTREDLVVTPRPMVARALDGGPERQAAAAPLPLRVRPRVDAAAPGAPERPTLPPPPPFPWAAVGGAASVAALAGALVLRRRGRVAAVPAPSAPPAPTGPTAAAVATAALAALAARPADTADGRRGAVVAITEVVRAYVADRFHVPTARRTSAEVLGAPFAATLGAGRAALAGVLARGDVVKFADHVPDAADLAAHLDAARAFVRATADGGPA